MKLPLILHLISVINALLEWEDVPCDTCLTSGRRQCLNYLEWFGKTGGSCCLFGSKDPYCRFSQLYDDGHDNIYCASTDPQEDKKYFHHNKLI